MLEGLRFWYEPEMEQIKINTIIKTAKYCNLSTDEILKALVENLPCKLDMAEQYLEKYNSNTSVAV